MTRHTADDHEHGASTLWPRRARPGHWAVGSHTPTTPPTRSTTPSPAPPTASAPSRSRSSRSALTADRCSSSSRWPAARSPCSPTPSTTSPTPRPPSRSGSPSAVGRRPPTPLHVRLRPRRGPGRRVRRAHDPVSAAIACLGVAPEAVPPDSRSTTSAGSPRRACSASSATSWWRSTASASASASAAPRWWPTAITPAPTASPRWRSLVGAVGVWLGFPLADPLVGLLDHARDSVRPQGRGRADVAPPHGRGRSGARRASRPRPRAGAEGVERVTNVRARWIGHTIHAEALIVADADLTLSEAHEIAERARHAMLHAVPKLTTVTVHVDPSDRRRRRPSRQRRPPRPVVSPSGVSCRVSRSSSRLLSSLRAAGFDGPRRERDVNEPRSPPRGRCSASLDLRRRTARQGMPPTSVDSAATPTNSTYTLLQRVASTVLQRAAARYRRQGWRGPPATAGRSD